MTAAYSRNVTIQCEDTSLDIAIELEVGLVVVYSVVAVCSLFGNLSVLLIVLLRSDMQTVTNMFVGSVSAADMLITAVSLWSTPLAFYQTVWKFGPFMCYAVYTVQGASLMWSPMTLAAIAIDRCLLVCHPFKKQITNRTCICIICGIWLAAILVLTPMLIHVHYFDVDTCFQYCIEIWPEEGTVRLMYGLTVLTIRSAAPLTIISYCHWRIACALNEQTSRLQSMRSANTLRHAADIRKKQRLQTLLLVMVIIFAVSSFPLDLFNVIQDLEMTYRYGVLSQESKQILFLVTHWVAMAGTLCNPLVYAWWSDNFRNEMQRIIAEFRRHFSTGFSPDALEASEASSVRARMRCMTKSTGRCALSNGYDGSDQKLMVKTTLDDPLSQCATDI